MTPVRPATGDDIPAMVDIGERFAAMSVNSGHGFDRDAIAALFAYMIETPMTCLLTNGTGILGGYVAPVYFNPAVVIAEEMFWYAEAGGMDLLKGFEEWAKAMGATRLTFSCMENESVDRMTKIYGRKGYAPCERKMVKVL